MRFEFSRLSLGEGEPASSFDLGDVRITGQAGTVTSAGRRPSASMMIYLSMALLIEGLREFIRDEQRRYCFTAISSSFPVEFRRKGTNVAVYSGNTYLGSEPITNLVKDLLAGVDEFLANPDNHLESDEPAAGDLAAAIAELRALQLP